MRKTGRKPAPHAHKLSKTSQGLSDAGLPPEPLSDVALGGIVSLRLLSGSGVETNRQGGKSMQFNTLDDVLQDQLADLYSAENQLVKALPKLVEAAHSPELRDAFSHHLEETRGHVRRLDEAFAELGVTPAVEECEAMRGLIEEGSEVVESQGSPAALDVALIAAAQRVEHYEIAAYGTARAIAGELGYDKVHSLLDETLSEEGAADKTLTKLAEGGLISSGINAEAAPSR